MSELPPITVETLLTLGRPDLGRLAFFDMEPDVVLFSNSNVHLTVGDVRDLQMFLRSRGYKAKPTRMEELMAAMPEGTRQ